MQIKWKQLLFCLGIPLFVGGLSALLTGGSMERFGTLQQPPLSPPGWLFPVAWTILYLLMGLASYLVWMKEKSRQKQTALLFYGVQLAVNFVWPLLFFKGEQYLLSFVWLVFLWCLIWLTLILFYRISKPAGYLLIPYLLWVTFAGYLNFGIDLLN